MSAETRYATEADRILDIEGNWDTKALRLHSYAERLQKELAELKCAVSKAVFDVPNISLHSDQIRALKKLGITPETGKTNE